MKEPRVSGPGHLSSVNKTLDVLEAFSAEAPQRSLADLSALLGISKPTLHRILQNLQARGYVRQDSETRRYRLGLKAWEVGIVGLGALDVGEVVRRCLSRLSEETGEQATRWVYDSGEAVCVDRSEASQRVRSQTRLGIREPVHLLAAGRVLLAFQPEDERTRVLAELRSSGVDVRRIREDLEQVRADGFAVNRGERWSDVFAVSAPIRDHTGAVPTAVSVSGPAPRFDEQRISVLAELVKAQTDQASTELGYAAALVARR